MGIRRKGRELAIQALYSFNFLENNSLNHNGEKILETLDLLFHESKKKNEKVREFSKKIIEDLVTNAEDIDEKIIGCMPNWSIDNMAFLDKCILRSAIAEMFSTEIPHPIIMNEAIEISKKFCSESSGKFINGILHCVSTDLSKTK